MKEIKTFADNLKENKEQIMHLAWDDKKSDIENEDSQTQELDYIYSYEQNIIDAVS